MTEAHSSHKHHQTESSMMEGPRRFYKDSVLFLTRCTKPDRREYMKILQSVSVGFLVMGFIGYFIKLVHIPINNIIVGGA